MTKKDYDLIAACLGAAMANSKSKDEAKGVISCINRIVTELGLANPRFNTNEFYDRMEYWRKSHGGE